MPTLIQVSDEIWAELKNRKLRPSQTFDDILRELIENESPKKTKQKETGEDY